MWYLARSRVNLAGLNGLRARLGVVQSDWVKEGNWLGSWSKRCLVLLLSSLYSYSMESQSSQSMLILSRSSLISSIFFIFLCSCSLNWFELCGLLGLNLEPGFLPLSSALGCWFWWVLLSWRVSFQVSHCSSSSCSFAFCSTSTFFLSSSICCCWMALLLIRMVLNLPGSNSSSISISLTLCWVMRLTCWICSPILSSIWSRALLPSMKSFQRGSLKRLSSSSLSLLRKSDSLAMLVASSRQVYSSRSRSSLSCICWSSSASSFCSFKRQSMIIIGIQTRMYYGPEELMNELIERKLELHPSFLSETRRGSENHETTSTFWNSIIKTILLPEKHEEQHSQKHVVIQQEDNEIDYILNSDESLVEDQKEERDTLTSSIQLHRSSTARKLFRRNSMQVIDAQKIQAKLALKKSNSLRRAWKMDIRICLRRKSCSCAHCGGLSLFARQGLNAFVTEKKKVEINLQNAASRGSRKSQYSSQKSPTSHKKLKRLTRFARLPSKDQDGSAPGIAEFQIDKRKSKGCAQPIFPVETSSKNSSFTSDHSLASSRSKEKFIIRKQKIIPVRKEQSLEYYKQKRRQLDDQKRQKLNKTQKIQDKDFNQQVRDIYCKKPFQANQEYFQL